MNSIDNDKNPEQYQKIDIEDSRKQISPFKNSWKPNMHLPSISPNYKNEKLNSSNLDYDLSLSLSATKQKTQRYSANVRMCSPTREARRVVAISNGFLPQRVSNVLQQHNIFKINPKTESSPQSPHTFMIGPPPSKVQPDLASALNLFPYSFKQLLTNQQCLPTASLVQQVAQKSYKIITLLDAIPVLIPGANGPGNLRFKLQRQVEAEDRVFKNEAQAKRQYEMDRDIEAASISLKLVDRIHSNYAEYLEYIIFKARTEEKYGMDLNIRAIRDLIDMNIVGKIKQLLSQVDPIEHCDRFLSAIKTTYLLSSLSPSIRDAFATDEYTEQMLSGIEKILLYKQKRLTVLNELDFFFTLSFLSRLNFRLGFRILAALRVHLLPLQIGIQQPVVHELSQASFVNRSVLRDEDGQLDLDIELMDATAQQSTTLQTSYVDTVQTSETQLQYINNQSILADNDSVQYDVLTDDDMQTALHFLAQQLIFSCMQHIGTAKPDKELVKDFIQNMNLTLNYLKLRQLTDYEPQVTFTKYQIDQFKVLQSISSQGKNVCPELLDVNVQWGKELNELVRTKLMQLIE
ncbi:Conserved_hypothetical protein [Hexamita inflata]|uniref:Uncharacterized protein n=1 Tax=Hexamita inflata TaxID=28002 RepID=A0AA86R7A4_9EUKA|nr:Conserved hypothetical protein [Hexamita inflata]